jgi:hypothetical protein
MNTNKNKVSHKPTPKKVCQFPDLTSFEVESVNEIQETRKVSYLNEGIRQTVWLPKEFVLQSL